jgi:hypothetical protein
MLVAALLTLAALSGGAAGLKLVEGRRGAKRLRERQDTSQAPLHNEQGCGEGSKLEGGASGGAAPSTAAPAVGETRGSWAGTLQLPGIMPVFLILLHAPNECQPPIAAGETSAEEEMPAAAPSSCAEEADEEPPAKRAKQMQDDSGADQARQGL